MKFNRRLYMVATLAFALLLFATNVYAANMTVTTGANGSITMVGGPFGTQVWTPVTADANGYFKMSGALQEVIFTITPDQFHQVDNVLVHGCEFLPDPQDQAYISETPGYCSEDSATANPTASHFSVTDFTNAPVATYHFVKPMTGEPDPQEGNYTFEVVFKAIPVKASFSVSPSSTFGEATYPIQFTDTSTNGADAWTWNFGDGTTSTEQHPVHSYAVPGTYTVTLTAENTQNGTTETTDPMAYTAIQPTITYTISAVENGSITPTTPSNTVTVDEGSSTTFTITPDALYQVADVFVDGDSVGAVGSVTFDITDKADHTITASFELIPNVSGPVTVGGTGYNSIMGPEGAYNAIPESGATIKLKAGEITEDLIFDDYVTFDLKGGYDDLFGLDDGYTTIRGNVKISYGKVTLSKVIIAPVEPL